jgi:hypothetical protein
LEEYRVESKIHEWACKLGIQLDAADGVFVFP